MQDDPKNLPGADVKEMDKEVFTYHNNLRENPKSLIPDL